MASKDGSTLDDEQERRQGGEEDEELIIDGMTSVLSYDHAHNVLTFIGHECRRIPKPLGRHYGPQTKRLDLSFNEIKHLDGLEAFPNLAELVLDNNYLDDNAEFCANNHLQILSLNKNKIKNLDLLLEKISSCFPNLRYLSLLGNEACPNLLSSPDKDDEDYQRYRYYVLYRLPKLKFLDSSVVKEEELQEALRIGRFMKVLKPTVKKADEADLPIELLTGYSPLPRANASNREHSTAFGMCRYRYSGKHSEGNRFIRNSDL